MQSPDKSLRVTIVQTEIIWHKAADNCARLAENIEQSLAAQPHSETDLIVLPEMFNSGFTMNAEKVAEDMKGPTIQWMISQARKHNAAVTGSLVIRENDQNYNRMIFATPDGEVTYYDKRHLFRMANEDQRYAGGDKQVVVNWRGWRIALNVCYDLRFPVWCRSKNNIDLMLFVASWPAARSYPWQTLLKARAIENLCYVIGVNRIGTDPNGIDHAGDSVLLDFKGLDVCYLASDSRIETCEISAHSLDDFRKKFPAWMDSDDFEITI